MLSDLVFFAVTDYSITLVPTVKDGRKGKTAKAPLVFRVLRCRFALCVLRDSWYTWEKDDRIL